MTKKIFTIVLVCFNITASSQERCGTEAVTEKMSNLYPEYRTAREQVNEQTKEWIDKFGDNKLQNIITIPVVVHVVWKTNAQNISDAQIQSQIDVLNNDYRRTNIDQINTPSVWQGIAADSEIEFCLASVDPNGQPTNGINRVQTTHGQFGMSNDIHTSSAGGADDWPNDDYLNIWVCDISSGLLGYATPPSFFIGDGDGLVIGYRYFGSTGVVQAPYNKGRTATHEIGHWLNLDHVWGGWGSCGNDQVSDTPKQESENYSCPGFPLNINSCNTTNPNGDMFMNYMDYTNDGCMNLFTNGQKARMIAVINQYRPNMLDQNLCSSTTNIYENQNTTKELLKIVDVLGRETNNPILNATYFYIYKNGTVEKKIIVK
jgi:hypothetical protein